MLSRFTRFPQRPPEIFRSGDPVDSIDNDGNGYVDDVHGWDFAGKDDTIHDGGPAGKRDHHGTHVAGTIAKASVTW